MAGTFSRIINGLQRTVQVDQSVTLASGILTKAVTFPSALQTGNSSPNVVAFIFNSTDTNPQYFPVVVTARSSTGFTASWSNATDTANYVLVYHVLDGWAV